MYADEILARIPPGSLVKPAQFMLQRMISTAQASITAKVLWRPAPKRPTKENAQAAGEHLATYFVPTNLISCLWVQLAQAVTGEFRFTRCKGPDCGKLILISARDRGGRSKRRETCSNRCRIALYTQRIQRAEQLHAAGKSVREIAVALGDDPSDRDVRAKIGKWIVASPTGRRRK